MRSNRHTKAHRGIQDQPLWMNTESMNATEQANKEKPGKKILIVEDDPNIAKALAVRLKSTGYDVTVAPDAMLGVSSALKTQPDLTLLDISLPAGDGFQVADPIQAMLPQTTPFIFVTASKQPGLRERAKELGAAGYFEKPYEAEDLLAAIKTALGE
jgi:two-component system KDP operon response regulator KdpE